MARFAGLWKEGRYNEDVWRKIKRKKVERGREGIKATQWCPLTDVNEKNRSNVPSDPYFQLVFPQPGMLTPNELAFITSAMNNPSTSRVELRSLAESIRANLNPHPSNQKQENVPLLDGAEVPGMQHKYRETVLFFPTEGQFCHSFCTYCFRWAQFTSVGSGQQFQSKDTETLRRYVARYKSVKDVLFTGGDPMVMSATLLRRYIGPLLHSPETAHLQTVRIGTKSLAYWPYRYLTDPDAKEVLKLFEDVATSGKHLAVQAHFSHPRELENPVVREAMRVIRMTGAQIRCQSPLIRHVNDDAQVWARMWDLQTRLGAIPYYM
jgi:L-lysine 2,3-aminomutase